MLFAFGGVILSARGEGFWNPFQRSDPELRAVRQGSFLIVSDYPFTTARDLVNELKALERRLTDELGVPGLADDVRIYVFDTHQAFSRYVRRHIPSLSRLDAHRRGMFLLRNGVPHIFVVRDEHFAASLRHEFVHVILNTSAHGLPLWLDEGLAVYYETLEEPERRAELERLLGKRWARGWRPDLARLEQLDEMPEMDELAYAEAWAWVRLLQEGPAEVRDLVPGYLRAMADGRMPAALSEQIGWRLADPEAAWQMALR